MKTFKLFSMAALAIMMCACSEEVNEIVQQPVESPGVIQFSGTVSTSNSVTRTKITEPGDGTLNVAWVVNDLILLYQDGIIHGTAAVKTLNPDGSANILGSLNNEYGGTYDLSQPFDVMYCGGWNQKPYMDEALISQYGVLYNAGGSDVSSYDFRKGTAKMKEDPDTEGKYIIDGAVKMTNQMAIWKLTLKDPAGNSLNVSKSLPVEIYSDDEKIAATGGDFQGGSTNVVYLAMYPVDNKTITIKYNDGTNDYVFSKAGISLAASTFYASEVTMTKVIDYSSAALGDLFYSDGTFSSTLEAGKTPIGVIAYLDKSGTDDDEITEKSQGAGHGLVLCLKNAASGADAMWGTVEATEIGNFVSSVEGLKRTTNVSGLSNTNTLVAKDDAATKYPAAYNAKNYTGLAAPTGTTGWFLPSAQQLVKMIEGLGGLSDGAPSWESWFDNYHSGATAWENALQKAGTGNYDSMISAYWYYQTSSEGSAGDMYVRLGIDATGTGSNYGFFFTDNRKANGNTTQMERYRARPVLAF